MIIYLHDTERDEDLKADLAVEYTLPCHDLFVVFSTSIHAGASKAMEYRTVKVSHLVGGRFSHGGRQYAATFGFFLSDQQLVPFLVDGACADGDYSGFGFGVDEQAYGHYPDRQALFQYPGAPSLLGNAKPLTFREAAARALEGDDGEGRAYALTPGKRFNLDGLVGHAEFSEYMESQLAGARLS